MTRTHTLDQRWRPQLEHLPLKRSRVATRSSGRPTSTSRDRPTGSLSDLERDWSHSALRQFIAGEEGHPGHPAVHGGDAAEGRLGDECI